MNGVGASSSGGDHIWTPKVNGKHNRHVGLKGNEELLLPGNHAGQMVRLNTRYKEILPGLESWQTQKIASWHHIEGHSIQWFCVVCIDRRGMLFFVFLKISI